MIKNTKVLVTGGAGFIGSNLIERLLQQNNEVVCLDNFSTGKPENIVPFKKQAAFRFIEGDIRDINTCREAVKGVSVVLHQAALGSVPRSVKDPITSNEVNVSGFLNMLVASRDEQVGRLVYAASSSTYGDSKNLPKVEDKIGKPLSPYAITKYVNELYADVFGKLYDMQLIGLRYFNVFGRRQDPDGAYAAVIPKFVKALIQRKSPIINGDGSFSRDFTYVDNVIQANQLAASVTSQEACNTVYNIAFGERTTLNQLVDYIREALSDFDPEIAGVKIEYGPERTGDIPHSLAAIDKAREKLGYQPQFDVRSGLKNAIEWYWQNLK
jgi:UDP-N-acetylglucosamine 4-epimerase